MLRCNIWLNLQLSRLSPRFINLESVMLKCFVEMYIMITYSVQFYRKSLFFTYWVIVLFFEENGNGRHE